MNSCPLESINVTKLDNTLKVDAKRVGSSTPEPSKYFTGNDRYHQFKRFWDFLTNNTPELSQCVNPLLNDQDYINAVGQQSSSSSGMTGMSTSPMMGTSIGDMGNLLPMSSTSSTSSTPSNIFSYDTSGNLFSDSTDNKIKHLLFYAIRSIILFVFIFILLTYIPKVNISLINRLIICFTIVFLNGIIDIVVYILTFLRSQVCTSVCGC